MANAPRKVTPERLERAALHYLERFAGSVDSLRQVLLRRVARSAWVHDGDAEDGARQVEAVLEKFVRLGLLDDRTFTQGRQASLRRQGNSNRRIREKLLHKGVAPDLIEEVMGQEDATAEFRAILALARRRRLGPYRAEGKRQREKDLAALARAGFSYDTAVRVVDALSIEELEEMA